MTAFNVLVRELKEKSLSETLPAPAATPELTWLLDNTDTYDAIAAAVQNARHSISITQLAFDADFAVRSEDSDDTRPVPFIELLLTASMDRGIPVRILLNSTLLLDTLKPLRKFVRKKNIGNAPFEMRGMSHFPQLLHAKMLIVDSEIAFLIGSPFVNGYWDSPAHRPSDLNRPNSELGGRPLHDVSVVVSGQAVEALESFFNELWSAGRNANGPRLRRSTTRSPGLARVRTTVPSEILDGRPEGSQEILRALLNGLGRARSLIYIEHQYLSSQPVFSAMRQALDREPDLEIIIVANQNPDVTAYARWQMKAFRKFGLLDHPRAGIFALWSAADAAGDRRELNQVFVHSKVVTIDDTWVMCGSANLDGVSLHSYGDDFARWPGRRIFRGIRNIDVVVVVSESGSLQVAHAGRLRRRLWDEHLNDHRASAAHRPAGGWVGMWREFAEKNVALLNDGRDAPAGSFILPYSTSIKPCNQLEACGIDQSKSGIELLFKPGWLERTFSPRWMRNMFL